MSDKVGNEAASADLAPMVIYMGGSFDWGDAPAPYTTLAADGGPRHLTDEGFALWIDDPNDLTDRSVTFESDARIPDQDDDNGVRVAVVPCVQALASTLKWESIIWMVATSI